MTIFAPAAASASAEQSLIPRPPPAMKAFFLLDCSSLYTFQILVNKGSRTRNEADQIIWQIVDQDYGKILVQLHYLMDLAETWSLFLQLPHGNEYRVR